MSKWIDAEWLLNFFEPYPDDYHTPLGTLRACVDDAPSIERKRGEWIDDDKHNHKYHRCSICGLGRFNWGEDNFCPNCGADMRGE